MFQLSHEELTRRQVLRRAGVGAAVLTLPGWLAACGGGDGRDPAAAPNAAGAPVDVATSEAEIPLLTWSLGDAPPGLDIATGFVANGVAAMTLGLESLVTLDDQLAVQPMLAESWSQPDAKTYVYRLRSGVTFWDGSPLTAEDVAYSLGRHIDPDVGSQLGGYYVNVRDIRATGDGEVTVRMTTPDPLFKYVPVFSFVTQKAHSEKLGKKLGAPGPTINVMGTGPYRYTQFSAERGITVERNEDYWGAKPAVAKAELRFIANPQTNLLAARSGEIDGRFEFPAQQAKDWDRLEGFAASYAPGMRVIFLSFDMDAEPWSDLHVRKAIAHCCDREGYVKAFLGGHGATASVVVSPAQWGALASPEEVEAMYAKYPQYPFDVERAKAELAQSAHADGFSATILVPDAYPEVQRALVSLGQTLKQLSIRLEVKTITQNEWLAHVYGHEDMALTFLTLGPDYPDPANFPAILFPSAAAAKNNFNTANFKNPEVDDLLAQQAGTTDDAARVRAIDQMLQITSEELPYFPLWFQDSSMAIVEENVLPTFDSLYYYKPWLAQVRARA